MKRYETQLAEVCGKLNEHCVRYVLVGASAMQLRGTTRATRHIDILIEPTAENATCLLQALSQLGFGLAKEWLAKEWLAEEIVRKPVSVIGDFPRVDVLTVAWTLHYAEAIREAVAIELEGVPIPTASLDHLIASKQTGRTQDAADIEVLEEIKRRTLPR